MANSTSIQILEDGSARTVLKVEGVLDTSDISSTLLVDPAAQATVDPTGSNYLKASAYRISKIIHNIEDGLSFNLFWDATSPVRIEELTGRAKVDYRDFGGLQLKGSTGTANTAPAGATGKIYYSTQGWSTGAILSFSVIVYLSKQY
jgi:hypothetical protein